MGRGDLENQSQKFLINEVRWPIVAANLFATKDRGKAHSLHVRFPQHRGQNSLTVFDTIADVNRKVQPHTMKHGLIVVFLTGALSPENLADEISAEVACFRSALKNAGEGRIQVTQGPLFVVTRANARRLLEAVADNRLPFDAANYLADCIVMNDNFDFADEAVRDAIFFIEDDTGRFATGDDNWQPSRTETVAALSLLD